MWKPSMNALWAVAVGPVQVGAQARVGMGHSGSGVVEAEYRLVPTTGDTSALLSSGGD